MATKCHVGVSGSYITAITSSLAITTVWYVLNFVRFGLLFVIVSFQTWLPLPPKKETEMDSPILSDFAHTQLVFAISFPGDFPVVSLRF